MKDRESLYREFVAIFGEAAWRHMASTGNDVVEGARQGIGILDVDGRSFVDCTSSAGIYNLGHRPPEIIEELRRAAEVTDQGNFPLISREKADLAEALSRFVPGRLECSVFSVIRGETVDFACKLARGATGRVEILTVDGGWYGQTGFPLSLSDRPGREAFGPLIPEVKIIPHGDLSAAEKAITERTAVVFLEPIQAENLCRMPDPSYARGLRDLCSRRGALLALDETQSGLGRTGRRFCFEHLGVEPDLLMIGEALGAGVFPIAATMYTQELNRFMNAHPMIHLSTFGGTDIGCRVALKALEIYEGTEVWRNAETAGVRLVQGLLKLQASSQGRIKSVSGKGLLLALELAGPGEANALCQAASAAGLLLLPGEVARHSVVLRPPLTLTPAEVDEILSRLDRACGSPGRT